jgi:hypothetical protein
MYQIYKVGCRTLGNLIHHGVYSELAAAQEIHLSESIVETGKEKAVGFELQVPKHIF